MVFLRLSVVCLLLLATLLSPCVFATPVKVQILTDDDYPPYSYVVDGKAAGIYVDAVMRAAELLKDDYAVEIIAMPWKRALKELEEGSGFAVLPPYIHRELRPFIHPYSIAIAEEVVVTYCREGVELEKAFVESLRLPQPIRLGINSGYLILDEKYDTASANRNLVVLENKSTEANMQKLLIGRIDCYANDQASIDHALANMLAKEPAFANVRLTVLDRISSQTVHIGYTQVQEENFPFKQDFVERMNQALLEVVGTDLHLQ